MSKNDKNNNLVLFLNNVSGESGLLMKPRKPYGYNNGMRLSAWEFPFVCKAFNPIYNIDRADKQSLPIFL